MGEVYLARTVAMGGFERLVALKLCHPQLLDDPEFVAMFLDEARIAASIRHPNVVGTLDVAQEDDALYMVMEYVEGASLASLLRRAAHPVDIPCLIRVCVDALRGLHAAHELRDHEGRPANVIHRDVTPQNLLVGLDGMSRLTDFGVAKAEARATVTKEGSVKGKLGYLAPEQLKGRPLDRRVDLFAAGVVVWEALVGRRLFRGATDADTVGQVLAAPIHPPSTLRSDVPASLDAVVMKALVREPDDRFATAEALAAALESAVTPASHATVGAWVRAQAGDELEARHQRSSSPSSAPPLAPAAPPDGPTQVSRVEELELDDPTAERAPDAVSSVWDVARPRGPRVTWSWIAALGGVVLVAAAVGVLASGDPDSAPADGGAPDAAPPRVAPVSTAPASRVTVTEPAVVAPVVAPVVVAPATPPSAVDAPASQGVEPSEELPRGHHARSPASPRPENAAPRGRRRAPSARFEPLAP
jgi:serine/threonine-protein kinase